MKRRELEDALLHQRLLTVLESPEQVQLAAKEIEAAYCAHVAHQRRAEVEAPAELRALDERIARLRVRLRQGEPDMAPDEIQAAIDRAEAKRRELEAQQPSARATAKMFALLPRVAEEFRRQIMQGLDGDERAVLRARVALRRHYGGEIRICPEPDGGIVAHWTGPELEHAIFQAVVFKGGPTVGSGGPLLLFPTRHRLSLAA